MAIPIWESGGFCCPGCGSRLQTSVALLRVAIPSALAIALVISFYLGFRGLTALGVGLLAFVPVSVIILVILTVVFPPSLQLFAGSASRARHDNPEGRGAKCDQSDQSKDGEP